MPQRKNATFAEATKSIEPLPPSLQFITESCASCGGTEKGSKRAEIKSIIAELKERSPFIEANIFKSVENVHLGTVICYKTSDGKKHHFLDDYDA